MSWVPLKNHLEIAMAKRGRVYYKNSFAGIIEENEDGFQFTYDSRYIGSEKPQPISLTMPVREEAFISKTMLPFFDGLIPEGWLIDIAEKNWKIDERNRMELLLTFCKDCIGAVSVIREEENK